MPTDPKDQEYYDAKYETAAGFWLTYLETPQTKLKATIINSTCASLSVLSSMVILFIISRSNTRLSLTYHRFLFAMSVGDLIGSFAIALSTLPMPKDMIYTQFEGKSIGNVTTLQMQGFCINYFHGLQMYYNFFLCIYYLCIIPFQISRKAFQKRFEPFVHFAVQAFHLPAAIIMMYTKVRKMHIILFGSFTNPETHYDFLFVFL